ncbi:hypothetical protein AB0M02_26435 [Actinoplanes sp. NPDC051861]|uniref:hypothetical protein n=1 Tax=Actinoplanes sp. NPDC051861 TaxID=3155170 RepID=UPI003425360D
MEQIYDGNWRYWFFVAALPVCLFYLSRARAWWDGRWRASEIRWRDRIWLVAMLATTLIVAALVLGWAEELSPWRLRTVRAMVLTGLLFAGFVPLTAVTRAFDFAVPPRLRYRPPTPEEVAVERAMETGNRAERRRRRRPRS